MSEEFSQLPDMNAMLAQRIAAKQGTAATPAPGTFDPYQAMLDRKNGKTPEPVIPEAQKWPEADVKKLQDYCTKMGIVGFNCGRMHPIAALAMLMKQFGEDYTNVPLEERVPQGYQKLGTKTTYSEAMQKKQILHG
jgi:hypothetical protein